MIKATMSKRFQEIAVEIANLKQKILELNLVTISTPAKPGEPSYVTHASLPIRKAENHDACATPGALNRSTFESRDIDKLTLNDLYGSQAQANEEVFISQVREIAGSDKECKNIVLAHMKKSLRLYVNGELQKHLGRGSFQDLENILVKDF